MKAYYIFDGNKAVDIILGNDRLQQAEITLDIYKGKHEWVNPEIIILDILGEAHKGNNILNTQILNGKPYKAYLNRNPEFSEDQNEYRIYTYRNDIMWV